PTCSHVLTEEFGEIKSPNYPNAYPDNLICSWTIRKPQNRSELIFLSFDVEESYDGRRCRFDVVFIQVGTHNRRKTYGPLCGQDIPGPFQFGEEVLITFLTDRIGAYSGFHAFYRTVGSDIEPSTPVPRSCEYTEMELDNITQCDYHIATESGIITSPNYPQDYGNNLHCSWMIIKPKNPSLLRFTDFEVEEVNWGDRCQFDYLYVFVGTGVHVTSYGPFCGNIPPEPIKYSDEVQITFTTDKNETRKGFAAEFGP
ncbi:CUB domain protein, partial [Opisthorchis viverrini]